MGRARPMECMDKMGVAKQENFYLPTDGACEADGVHGQDGGGQAGEFLPSDRWGVRGRWSAWTRWGWPSRRISTLRPMGRARPMECMDKMGVAKQENFYLTTDGACEA